MCNPYMESLFGLEGRTAIITGGGGTLGTAIGSGLAQVGANIVLWDVREEALAEKVQVLRDQCGDEKRIDSVKVDLMSEDSIREALDVSVSKYGRVDILLNACGGNRGKCPLTEQKIEDFEFVLKLNLLAGCFTPTKVIAGYWIEKGIKGAIINIASMAGYNPLSGVWAYSAAKAAVMNQTMAAATELAPHGIRVNAIAPGFFLADQNRALLIDESTGEPTARGREVLARTPFGRFGEPEELAGVVILLASSGAGSFVSGVTVPIDGAYLCNNI